MIKKSRKSLLGVGLLVLAPSLDDNLELPLVEGHQAEVEAGEQTGETEEESDEDGHQPGGQQLSVQLETQLWAVPLVLESVPNLETNAVGVLCGGVDDVICGDAEEHLASVTVDEPDVFGDEESVRAPVTVVPPLHDGRGELDNARVAQLVAESLYQDILARHDADHSLRGVAAAAVHLRQAETENLRLGGDCQHAGQQEREEQREHGQTGDCLRHPPAFFAYYLYTVASSALIVCLLLPAARPLPVIAVSRNVMQLASHVSNTITMSSSCKR